MFNILLLRKNIDKINPNDWLMSDLVISINEDGTFELVKNRFGSKLPGKMGELLDAKIFLKSEIPSKVDLGI